MISSKTIQEFISKVEKEAPTDLLIVGVDDKGKTSITTAGNMLQVMQAIFAHLYDKQNPAITQDLQNMLINITFNAILKQDDELSGKLIGMFYDAMNQIQSDMQEAEQPVPEPKEEPKKQEKAKTVYLYGSQAPKVD